MKKMVEERVYSGTCLGVVPIHAGVLAIGILQVHGLILDYMYTESEVSNVLGFGSR